MIGQIVCSKAGRDKGKFMVCVGEENGMVLVCDGKERSVRKPKRKNIKHLVFTNRFLEKSQFASDSALKRALSEYRGNKLSF